MLVILANPPAVSYTHLDVYKRQVDDTILLNIEVIKNVLPASEARQLYYKFIHGYALEK